MLKALLENDMDEIAVKYIDYLQDSITDDMIMFAIKNRNEEFLKFILLSPYISRNFLYEETLIEYVINLLSDGETLVFGLKLLKLIEPQRLGIIYNK